MREDMRNPRLLLRSIGAKGRVRTPPLASVEGGTLRPMKLRQKARNSNWRDRHHRGVGDLHNSHSETRIEEIERWKSAAERIARPHTPHAEGPEWSPPSRSGWQAVAGAGSYGEPGVTHFAGPSADFFGRGNWRSTFQGSQN